jgi:hypothetical protein
MEPYEDPENWPEVDVLRGQVIFHRKEEERLQGAIPEEVTVSVFKVSTKVIRDLLAAKHKRIADETIHLIAKIAKFNSNKILDDFEKSNIEVEAEPKDIEELSATKTYM